MQHVDINLIIHRDNDNIKIGFPFDVNNDNVDKIVSELSEALRLRENESIQVKEAFEEQLKHAIERMNSENGQMFDLYSSDLSDSMDEEVFSDPEYQDLLRRQREEIDALEENHVNSQRDMVIHPSSPGTMEDLIMFSS